MTGIEYYFFFLDAVIMIALLFLVYISAIFLHEAGHLLVLRKNAKKARINFDKIAGKWKLCAGKEEDYLNLSDKELKRVYKMGIIFGLFPIALYSIVNVWGLVLFPLYLGGCSSDLKRLRELIKRS